MNMNDNYLWDRTGEPDAEVQQLEELLGPLRYQPRPLEIPASMTVRRRRLFIPLAIAAAIALLMIGGGLWIRFASSTPGRMEQADRGSQPAAAPGQGLPASPESAASSSQSQIQTPNSPKLRRVNQVLVALKPGRPIQAPRQSPGPSSAPALTETELAQKEQVLIALRLVSAKLNLAQRKSQGLPQVNSIRNQHKIG
jgi:hypothetical protein